MLLPREPDSRVTWKEWIENEDQKIKLVMKEDSAGCFVNVSREYILK